MVKDTKNTPRKTATAAKAQLDSDIQATLNELIKILDTFLMENIKLREQNETLTKRIETLENLLTEKKDVALPPPSATPSSPVSTPSAAKVKYHALIISDSMLRHVGGDCPIKSTAVAPRKPKHAALIQDIPYVAPNQNPPLLVKKIVVPGATSARLYNEAMLIAKDFTFDHVICHCGTNYVPFMHPDDAIEEVSDLLDELKIIFKCKVTFSPILPKLSTDDRQSDSWNLSNESKDMINTIRNINSEVYRHCLTNNIGSLLCEDFVMDSRNPVPRKNLLAKDGCHLSRCGIVAMEHTIFEVINTYTGVK